MLTEGSKPQTSAERSRVCLKFLNVCDRPIKYEFYNRFNKVQTSNVNMDKLSFARDLPEIERLKSKRG